MPAWLAAWPGQAPAGRPVSDATRLPARRRLPPSSPFSVGRLTGRAGRPHPPQRISAWSRLIAHTANRHDDLRPLRVLLDLGPKALDVDVDQPGVRGVPVSPDLLEQDLAGEHLARLAGQRAQQVEFQ